MISPSPRSGEKEFYLQHFRRRAIVIHAGSCEWLEQITGVLDQLVANETLVVVSLPGDCGRDDPVTVREADLRGAAASLIELSTRLLDRGIAHAAGPAKLGAARRIGFSCRLALRLRAHKLVVVDSRGGLRDGSGVRSFVTAAQLGEGREGDHDGWTPAELAEVRDAAEAGVESVNLAAPAELGAELFTYEGAGTLVTAGEYASVEPLGVDDFPEALALLERGEGEGFLLSRSAEERARLLLSGYGVRLEGRRLAGIAGLRRDGYTRQKLAEVVGLYTITRFQGEGVGVRLLEELALVAARDGARALFACTSSDRALAFFERNGFSAVDAERVPAAKWEARTHARPSAVLWRKL